MHDGMGNSVVTLMSIQVIAERKPPRIKRQNTFTIAGDSGEKKRAKTETDDMDGVVKGSAAKRQSGQHASHGRRSVAAAAKPQSSLTATTPRTRNGVLGDHWNYDSSH